MTTIDFGDWLKKEIARKDMTQSKVARKARIDKGIISRAIRGERLPNPYSLNAIARGLKLSPKVVFEAAGLLQFEPEEYPGSKEWTFILSQLQERERDELLQIARLKLERQEQEQERKALGSRVPEAGNETREVKAPPERLKEAIINDYLKK